MTRVLLVAALHPARPALADALQRMAAAGARVSIAFARDPKHVHGNLPYEDVRRLAPRLGLASGRKPRRFTPTWFYVVARNLFVRAVPNRLSHPARTWFLAKRDPWMAGMAREVDVIVAIDRYAVYTAWKLAKQNPGAAVYYGLDAGARDVEARAVRTPAASR